MKEPRNLWEMLAERPMRPCGGEFGFGGNRRTRVQAPLRRNNDTDHARMQDAHASSVPSSRRARASVSAGAGGIAGIAGGSLPRIAGTRHPVCA